MPKYSSKCSSDSEISGHIFFTSFFGVKLNTVSVQVHSRVGQLCVYVNPLFLDRFPTQGLMEHRPEPPGLCGGLHELPG